MYLRNGILAKKLLKTYNVTNSNYSLYSAINYTAVLCFFSHFIFLSAFFAFNIIPLALFNILSCTVYIITFLVNRRGRHNLALGLDLSEVVIHAVLAVLYIGWSTGFQYYLFCIVPLVFFSPSIIIYRKIAINAFFALTYVIIYNYSLLYPPIYKINFTAITGFNYFNIVFAFAALSFAAYYYSWAVKKVEILLKDSNKKLEALAQTDFLTGLFNRRKVIEEINKGIEEYKKNGTTFIIIIGDVDNFKAFNDEYGHYCGDLVLTTSAAVMKSQVLDIGTISRWGGEEFLILLPESSLEQGKELAEKLRKSVQDTSVIYNDTRVSITMTFGVYCYDSHISLEEAVNNADKALYDGKRRGRNCVVA